MADSVEQERLEVYLVSEEERELRPLFNNFYGYMKLHSPNGDVYGPVSLGDTSFDRMMHERAVLGFLVGRVAARGAIDSVIEDASLRESKPVSADELPTMIARSLVRVRQTGEWDNSLKSRETRKALVAKGLKDHADYPLISEAIKLGAMLKYDGLEVYATDAIAATSKWLERVNRLQCDQHTTGKDPAA